MLAKQLTGPHASAAKYDLLTALGALALSEGKAMQCLCLRLMTLLTARYNWSRDSLTVGQREIARLWCVDERTVKREMAKLRNMGWLVVRRQGARGRVTDYRLDISRILKTTEKQWQAVGPDFKQRMEGPQTVNPTVVPFPTGGTVAPPNHSDDSEWGRAQGLLFQEDPSVYGAWLQTLRRKEKSEGLLVLTAPTQFHAQYVNAHHKQFILRACQSVDDELSDIILVVET